MDKSLMYPQIVKSFFRLPITNTYPIGITTLADTFTELIPANTQLPFNFVETFSTGVDDQSAVDIRIIQKKSQSIELIDNLYVSSIPLAPRGIPRVELNIFINAQKKLDVLVIVQVNFEKFTRKFGPYSIE